MLIEALGLCKGGEEGRDYIVCRWAYAIYYYCGISQHGVLVSLVLVLVLFVFGIRYLVLCIYSVAIWALVQWYWVLSWAKRLGEYCVDI